MEKQKKKRIQTYASWVLLGAVVMLLACMPLLAGRQELPQEHRATILSAKAERRDITSSLMGGGTLTAREAVEVTIPADVKLTRYLVENGDTVEAGDPIASVDRVTVMTAITQVQQTMEQLSEQIRQVQEETAPDEVTALKTATVKKVYAREGETVQQVMLRDGALAVLSLDGLMTVRIEENTALAAGEQVGITFPDGREATGQVESNLEGILTVTLVDEGYALGETVTVFTQTGERIGSGQLAIHSQWNAVAYSGTVAQVRIREDDTVTSGQLLIQLEDTGHTAQYDQLTAQRRKYEQWMLTLFQMYQTRTVTADCDGIVTGVEKTGAYMLSGEQGWHLDLLVNAPDGNEEEGYVNYIGQVTQTGTDGLILKMNPQPLQIQDYKELSAVPLDPELMTEEVIYAEQLPVYTLLEGEWAQVDMSAILPGDLLLFAGREAEGFVWVVRIPGEEPPPEETEPTEPEAPSEPEEPAEPTEPEEPSEDHSRENTAQQGAMSPGGAQPQEEEESLYALETVTVAAVTPQKELLLEITLDELDVRKVREGQEAQVMVNALGGEVFDAAVSAIANTGESDGGNSKFRVTLILEKQGDMLPGMTASAQIPLETVRGCVAVPVAALTETDTQTILYRGYEEKTEKLMDPAAAALGISDGEWVQVLSGLEAGETVWYPYYELES